MKQVFITGYGGVDRLQMRESPDPTPGNGEVRIRVKAIGINFADILARQGLYADAPKVPCVVGYEVSGIVDATGAEADSSWLGKDAVALTRFGGYSDVLIVPMAQVFEKPGSLSHERAAAIPINYLTAWQLLIVMGSLKSNETVLIHNAGGGVGLAAIDIARHIGARIFGTASSGKHAFLKERGLHEAIDYRTGDWTRELARLTERKGVELVIDPIGGSHWRKSFKALRSTGRLGMFGISAATTSRLFGPLRILPIALGMPLFHPIPLVDKNKSVFGVNLAHLWHEGEMIAGWMQILLQGVADSWVRPHVDKRSRLPAPATRTPTSKNARIPGKIVLVPEKSDGGCRVLTAPINHQPLPSRGGDLRHAGFLRLDLN
jgi:synaptic vesicle membrane protein VAT-1